MTLPSTGTISMSQVSTELGRPSTDPNSLNNSSVRSLAGVASGAISFSNLRGKTYTAPPPPSSTPTMSLNPHTITATSGGGVATAKLTLNTNGILNCSAAAESGNDFGDYAPEWAGATIPTANASQYEYLWTLNSGTAPTGPGAASTWISLTNGVSFSVSQGSVGGINTNFQLNIRHTASSQQLGVTIIMSATWNKLA